MDMMRFNDFYLRFYNANLEDEGEALLKEFYVLWCEAEDGGVEMDMLVEEAENCLHHIATTDLFTIAACEWIGTQAHYSISKALAHQISVRYLQHPTLVRFALATAQESSATAVASRLCALEVPTQVALGWALSLDEDLPASPRVSNTVANVADFLATEHPATCKRLLEADRSPFTHSTSARAILHRLLNESRELEALPHLVELQMSSEMRRSFRYLRRNENRAITEHARGQSLFEMLITAKHFKYSNQVAFEYQNGGETVDAMVPMITQQMSIELPQTWIVDPMLYGRMKIEMWRATGE